MENPGPVSGPESNSSESPPESPPENSPEDFSEDRPCSSISIIPEYIPVISQLVRECLADRIVTDEFIVFDEDAIRFVIIQIITLCGFTEFISPQNQAEGNEVGKTVEEFLLSTEKDLLAVWVILTTSSVNTGKFAFSYNARLNHAIITRNEKEFLDLWQAGIANFVELFQNNSLSDTEKSVVQEMIHMEFSAVAMAIEKCLNDIGHLYMNGINTRILNCPSSRSSSRSSGTGFCPGYGQSSIYSLTYSEIATTKKDYFIYPGMDRLPNRVMYAQRTADGQLHFVQIDTMKLIREISLLLRNSNVGKDSNIKNNRTIQILYKKFIIEIKMYQYYLEQNYLPGSAPGEGAGEGMEKISIR